MTDARLARYAAFAPVHLAIVVLALAGVFGAAGGPVVAVASLPLLFAWGPYQADVAVNLTGVDRDRWRIGLWMLPWSMTAYWLLHVRPRHD